MPSENFQKLVSYLSRNLKDLHPSSSTGSDTEFPGFDLTPYDYLAFAETELEGNSPAARINCVGHLKRAMECELDTLLFILKLEGRVRNFPAKVEFLSDIGILSSRSLVKLNGLRNRMEHDYANPDLESLEIYFDLVSSVVQTIEGAIHIVQTHQDFDWDDGGTWDHRDDRYRFSGSLRQDAPIATFTLRAPDFPEQVVTMGSDISEYAEGLRIYFLMCRAPSLVSREYVISKLSGTPLAAARPRA